MPRTTPRKEGAAMSAFSDEELVYLQGEAHLGRLSTIDEEGMPHVVPVGWRYDADFRLPLSALFAQALAAFTLEFEREVADAGFPDLSLALGSNALRFLDSDEDLRIGAIAARAGVSKQAASQQVAHLEKHGYVEVGPDPEDSRAKVVRLTPRGRRSQEVCRPLLDKVEHRWEERYGPEVVRSLRTSLEALVIQLEDTLPHYPSR